MNDFEKIKRVGRIKSPALDNSPTAEDIMSSRVEFKTLDEIKGHAFYGNHAFDHQAFQGISRFVDDKNNSIQDRGEAIRIKADKGMGCGRLLNKTDEELIEEHKSFKS